jgi:hypothetical protein
LLSTSVGEALAYRLKAGQIKLGHGINPLRPRLMRASAKSASSFLDAATAWAYRRVVPFA